MPPLEQDPHFASHDSDTYLTEMSLKEDGQIRIDAYCSLGFTLSWTHAGSFVSTLYVLLNWRNIYTVGEIRKPFHEVVPP